MKKSIPSIKKTLFLLAAIALLGISSQLFSQGAPRLQGKVTNGGSGQPVDFGTVIVYEAKKKGVINEDGTFDIYLPSNGTFTVEIRVDGLRSYKESVIVRGNTSINVTLRPLAIRGGGITIRGDRKQDLSRRSLTVGELDAVPATFGDPVSALASLPGVMRYGGGGGDGGGGGGSRIFGQLVVRGMRPTSNRFFVDGIPMQYPQHFGGLHSVVASELMASIDLYSSAFPAEFNGGMGSVIQINTLDEVDTFGMVSDVSLISTTALVKTPLYSDNYINGQLKKEKNGYLIVSGRVGYLSVIMPYILELFVDTKGFDFPDYWDYQVKYKHYFNSRNSITMTAMGAKDWWVLDVGELLSEKDREKAIEDGEDPYFTDFAFSTDQMFHNQAISYKYSGGKFTNTLIGYSTLPYYYNYFSLNNPIVSDALKDIEMTNKPFEFGVRNETILEYWENHSQLEMSIGYTNYYFVSDGDVLVANEYPEKDANFFTDENLLTQEYRKKTYINHLYLGHIANRFTFGGLTFVPQVRVEHLDRAKATVVDPRGMISYEFPTATTISAASGLYHEFAQTNPYSFNNDASVAGYGEKVRPERSVHNSVGVKQEFDLYSLSVEGFYNKYYDLLEFWPYTYKGEYIPVKNEGEKKSYGAELMLKKESLPNVDDMFGWISYTYTQSEERSNIPRAVDSSGRGLSWWRSSYEQEHAVKLVTGYRLGKHTFTGQFQLYTTTPYTKIVGSKEDEAYAAYWAEQGEEKHRYAPVYSDEVNGSHMPASHQLDLRYSYNFFPSWGSVKWYFEVINIYARWNPSYEVNWKYNKSYQKNKNPEWVKNEDGYPIPNAGVEIKF